MFTVVWMLTLRDSAAINVGHIPFDEIPPRCSVLKIEMQLVYLQAVIHIRLLLGTWCGWGLFSYFLGAAVRHDDCPFCLLLSFLSSFCLPFCLLGESHPTFALWG